MGQHRDFYLRLFVIGVCVAGTVYCASIKNGQNGAQKWRNKNRVGNCSFEINKLCGWKNTATRYRKNEFNWLRTSRRTPSSGTGPKKARAGFYYMYVESSAPRKLGDRATLENGPYNGIMCLSFYYHMHGYNIGSLQVTVLDSSEYFAGGFIDVLRLDGEQGDRWKRAQVTVYGAHYQIQIVGTVGTGYRGDIAIDNITLIDGTCSKSENEEQLMKPFEGPAPGAVIAKGSCEFERRRGLCGWTNIKNGDTFDWRFRSGPTETSRTGPPGDWKGGKGGYLYIEASAPRVTGDYARLLSPLMCGQVCMRFYYSMFGSGTGSLSVYRREGVNKTLDTVWRLRGNQGPGWRRGMVELNSDLKCYRTIIEATRGNSYQSDIAIDGIAVEAGSCCKLRSELNLLQKHGNCNFNKGFCGWKNVRQGDVFDWSLSKGARTPSKDTGPMKSQGGYIYIEASEPRVKGDTAVLVSSMLQGSLCMRFRYQMNGVDSGSLKVYRNGDGVFQQLLWQRSGNHGDRWIKAAVSFDCSVKSYYIELEGVRGTDWRGDIAVDDIVFTNDVCPEGSVGPSVVIATRAPTTAPPARRDYLGVCDFARSFCFWENDIKDEGDWTRHTGRTPSGKTGPAQGYDGGHYIYTEASDMKAGDKARLLLNAPLKGQICIKFVYHMYGQGIGKLTIDTRNEKSQKWVTRWNMTGSQGFLWRQALLPLKGNNYRVSLVATRGKTFEGDIAVDNLEIIQGACDSSYVGAVNLVQTVDKLGCDFERCYSNSDCRRNRKPNIEGCQWFQEIGDKFDWTSRSGTTPSAGTGPRKALQGKKYLYIEASSPRRTGDRARLSIKITNLKKGTFLCMRFYYHIHGSGVGTLNIYRTNSISSTKDVLFSKTRLRRSLLDRNWNMKELSFSTTGAPEEKITIEGVVGRTYQSDIAIDDISFRSGFCQETDIKLKNKF